MEFFVVERGLINHRCVRGLTIDVFGYLGPDDAVSDSTDGWSKRGESLARQRFR